MNTWCIMFTFELYDLRFLEKPAENCNQKIIYRYIQYTGTIIYNYNYTILDWEWCCCRCGSLRSPHWTAIIWSTTLRTLQEFQCMATSITTTQCLCWCHGVIGWCTELVAFGFWHGFCHIFSYVYTYIYIYEVYILNWSILPSSISSIHPSITSLICKAWHIAIKRRGAAKSICRRFVVVLACRSVHSFVYLILGRNSSKMMQDVVFVFWRSWHLADIWGVAGSWSMWIKLQCKMYLVRCVIRPQDSNVGCSLIAFDIIWYLIFSIKILDIAVGTYLHFSGWAWIKNSPQACDEQHTLPDILEFNTGLLVSSQATSDDHVGATDHQDLRTSSRRKGDIWVTTAS